MEINYLNALIQRHPSLETVKNDISAAFDIIAYSFANGGKLLIGG